MKEVTISIIGKPKKRIKNNIIKILNNYAINYDCDNTIWIAKIGIVGIEQLKEQLSKFVNKNIAVVCLQGTKEIFRIGKKKTKFKFDYKSEQVFNHYNELKTLCSLSAILHDIGKSNDYFQWKLQQFTPLKDPFRHEYISCKIIEFLCKDRIPKKVKTENDEIIYKYVFDKNDYVCLLNGSLNINELEIYFEKQINSFRGEIHFINTEKMTSVEKLICYLIISHHRLPFNENDIPNEPLCNLDSAIQYLTRDNMGYNECNSFKELEDRQIECFKFSHGISLYNNESINNDVCKNLQSNFYKLITNINDESFDSIANDIEIMHSLMFLARNVLMLADHKFSSTESKYIHTEYNENIVYANTKQIYSEQLNKKVDMFNQSLHEHLNGVYVSTVENLNLIYFVCTKMPKTTNKKIEKNIKKDSQYYWQQNVYNVINKNKTEDSIFFVCNVASTGKGKTNANVKIMNAINKKMRYNLCVGLTTLVEQTFKSYKKLEFENEDIAICIGADEKEELHNLLEHNQDDLMDVQTFLEEDLNQEINEKYFDVMFSKGKNYKKYTNFLWKPILVSTIDYLMKITQTKKGGKHLLPSFRLMSSDVIIDEIDDFSITDIRAILALAFMTGVCGKNLVISSATISQNLALSFKLAHEHGLASYNKVFTYKDKVQRCVVCDEDNAIICNSNEFVKKLSSFMKRRVTFLNKQPIKAKAKIVDIDTKNVKNNINSLKQTIINSVYTLHENNHVIDKDTQKNVSIGCIRIANVNPCVDITKFMTTQSNDDCDIFVMAYHSRQILLVREVQESFLQRVLNRKGHPLDGEFNFDIEQYKEMYQDIKNSTKKNIIFILVATSVEEVDRDHDFDWCIIEPSSLRSVVQMAGRVHRHRSRKTDIKQFNINILQYNINYLNHPQYEQCFVAPGIESKGNGITMQTKDAYDLFDKKFLNNINSSYCIRKFNLDDSYNTKFHLAEQKIYSNLFNGFSIIDNPMEFGAYEQTFLFLSGIQQNLNKFRKKEYITEDIILTSNGDFVFIDFKDKKKIKEYTVPQIDKTPVCYSNLWMKKNYDKYLLDISTDYPHMQVEDIALKYGGISIIPPTGKNVTKRSYFYDDDMGCYYTSLD